MKILLGTDELTLNNPIIKTGTTAPNFTVVKDDFSEVELESFKGKKILISSYPSVDTSVCALQTKRFNQEASKLDNVVILSLSVDLPPALKRFCAAEGIDNLQVLSDHKLVDFGTKYGFLIEELRLLARGVVIIDENFVVQYVDVLGQVTDEPNYVAALEALNNL